MNRFALLVVVMLPLASCAPACFDGLATLVHDVDRAAFTETTHRSVDVIPDARLGQ